MTTFHSSLEPLEQRIAPASLVFMDVDGDMVKLTVSKGSQAQLEMAVTLVPSGAGLVFQKLNLTSPVYKGANVTLAITDDGNGGDGIINVGAIDATGVDLGKIIVPGELGQIDAGDSNLTTPAVKLLQVGALGGTASMQAGTASYESVLKGPLTKLEVSANVAGTLRLDGSSSTGISSLHVGGALQGKTGDDTGSIHVPGSVGIVKIDGNLQGGAGVKSGTLMVDGSIGTVTIGGSLLGGPGMFSGSLVVGKSISTLLVNGSVVGSAAAESAEHNGVILANKITKATIQEAIQGGSANLSGLIDANGLLQSILVQGGLQGGAGAESGSITGGMLGKVILGTSASTQGGAVLQGGSGLRSGSLLSGGSLSSVEAFGSVQGGSGELSGSISTVGAISKALVHGKLLGGSGPGSGTLGSGTLIQQTVVEGNIEGGTGAGSGRVVSTGSLGTVLVKGELHGSGGSDSGSIGAPVSVGSVRIKGNVVGGGGFHSGSVLATGTLGQLVVDGALLGGSGANSAYVEVGTVSSIRIADSLTGNTGASSGAIFVHARARSIDIGGSLLGYAGSDGRAASFNASIDGDGQFDFIHIGKEVQGGSATSSGSINSNGRLGTVNVDGSLRGGDGVYAGSVVVRSNEDGPPSQIHSLAKLTIGGAIFGGTGSDSGRVESAGLLTSVNVSGSTTVNINGGQYGGSVLGNVGPYSGSIYGGYGIGSVRIAQNLSASSAATSGKVYSSGSIGQVLIGGSMLGSSASENSSFLPGQIAANGRIGLVQIHNFIQGSAGDYSAAIVGGSLGSIKVGGDIATGSGQRSAALIATGGNIETIVVTGNIAPTNTESVSPFIYAQGNIGFLAANSLEGQPSLPNFISPVAAASAVGQPPADSSSAAFIMARGLLNPTKEAQATAIGSIKVADHLYRTQILAGFDETGLVNGSARIGMVDIGGKSKTPQVWLSNDIVAGFSPGSNGTFGDSDDTQGGAGGKIHSRIASVIIHGQVEDNESRHAIEAVEVVSLVVGGAKFPLAKGVANDAFVPVATGLSTVVNETQVGIVGEARRGQ